MVFLYTWCILGRVGDFTGKACLHEMEIRPGKKYGDGELASTCERCARDSEGTQVDQQG